MQNEVDKEGGFNESNWRRSGDVSKNVPELKKRLLSRNRIYAVPDERSNGHASKLPGSRLTHSSAGSSSSSSRDCSSYSSSGGSSGGSSSNNSKKSIHPPSNNSEIRKFGSSPSCIYSYPPAPEQQQQQQQLYDSPCPERKQSNFKDRARKLIAPSKEERASSLDLWDGSSLYTGTVKRRPPPPGTKRALSLENSSQFQLKFPHQQQQQEQQEKSVVAGEGGGEGTEEKEERNKDPRTGFTITSPCSIPTLTTCPKENNSHIGRVMGNTFTTTHSRSSGKKQSARVLAFGHKNAKRSPTAISQGATTPTSSSESPELNAESKEKGFINKRNAAQVSSLPSVSFSAAGNGRLQISSSSSLSCYGSLYNANELHGSHLSLSMRTSSPDSLPPISILADDDDDDDDQVQEQVKETFESQLIEQCQARISSCRKEKTLEISHSQIECDNLVRGLSGSSCQAAPCSSPTVNIHCLSRNYLKETLGPETPNNIVEMSQVDSPPPMTTTTPTLSSQSFEQQPDSDNMSRSSSNVSSSHRANVNQSVGLPSSATCSRATSCIARNLLDSSKCDSQVIPHHENDISCRTTSNIISPSPLLLLQAPPNEQLVLKQSDLSALEESPAPSKATSTTTNTAGMECQALELHSPNNACNISLQQHAYSHGHDDDDASISSSRSRSYDNNNDNGNNSQTGAASGSDYTSNIVSVDRLMTTSVICPSITISTQRSHASFCSREASPSRHPTPATAPNYGVATILVQSKINPINFIKIYTDWANHYLDKARCKRHIQDLQVDVTDGVILSDVVEAVTNQKVPDVIRKPKNSSQMLDNIHACLVFLAALGVSLEGITARDVRDGHLKSILSLFFQLSRYKQQQKQQDRDRHNLQKQSAEMQQTGIKTVGPKHAQDSSKLPPPFNKHGSTSIPIPASASTPKKIPQEKGKAGPGLGNGPHAYPGGSVKPASGSSSRSTSPSAVSGIPQSFIPTPRTSIPSAPSSARSSLHEKHISNVKNSGAQSKSSVRSQNNNSVNSVNLATSNNHVASSKNNSSMLEKFKFFKEKDKGGDKPKNSTGSKRTSSSSGFSSARSERSDSSVSLSSETKASSTEKPAVISKDSGNHKSIVQQSSIVCPSVEPTQNQSPINNTASTPRLAIKGFRQKIGKAISSKESKVSHSPKSSRKESVVESSASSKGSLLSSKAQTGKLESTSNGGSGSACDSASSSKDVPSSQPVPTENGSSKRLEKDRDREKQLKIDSKLRNPRQGMDSVSVVGSSDSLATSSNSNSSAYSFMRHGKPNGVQSSNSSSRESRNRFSGTGIPTRNSLIGSSNVLSNANGNSNSRDELLHSNSQVDAVANANSLNSSMSSMNGLVGNGTGIPKPTAAVKGTTKMIVTQEANETISASFQQPSNTNVQVAPKDSVISKTSNNFKQSNNKVVSSTQSSVPSNNAISNGTYCSKGEELSAPPTENVSSEKAIDDSLNTSSPKKPNKNEIVSNGISIAMVSPMPNATTVGNSVPTSNAITSMSSVDSTLSQSNSNSSEASVILLTGKLVNFDKSTEDSNDANDSLQIGLNQTNCNTSKSSLNESSSVSSMSKSDSSTSPCANDDALNLNSIKSSNGVIVECEEDELMVNVTPMEPLLRNSPYGYMKTPGGVSSGFLSPKSPNANHPPLTRIVTRSDSANNHRVLNSVSNRQIYNPYCDPVRLVVRKQVSGNKYASSQYSSTMGDYDYTEIDNLDVTGTGYLSDGDLLMSGNNGNRPSDGYLSESGASIYSRRIHQTQRAKETFQGGSSKHALITEDRSSVLANGPDLLKVGGQVGRIVKGRFDDSSSISSGISDLNEIPTDLTSSSVNSELSSPYASLQRPKVEAPKKKELVDPQSIIYRVVGSRGGNLGKKQGNHNTGSHGEINSPVRNQVNTSSPCDRKDSNGHNSSSYGVEFHQYQHQQYNLRSEVNSKVQVRDKHGNLASCPQLLYGSSNGIQSGAPPSSYLLQSSQQTTSNAKRPDSKAMNNLESKKKGMMGMKEEYYGKEMADRLIKEERDRDSKERHRSLGHSHSSHNAHKGSSNGSSSDGKRSTMVKSATPTSYGYVRRSNGSGNCVVTKYSISQSGKVNSEGRPEKELLTAEEYKAAQMSLLSRLDSKGNEMHPNSFMGPGMGTTAVTASPKTRTKVKISGGTQTTNDLHEMNRHHSHNHQTQPQQSHHHSYHQKQNYPVQQHGNCDADYASSTCSRNSGSFSSQSQPGYKSLSLTTPTATQLSQSLRERILGSQSLPKAATSSADYAAILAAIQQQQQHQIYGTPNASKERMARYNKIMNDGSMSDTGGYSNYSEIQAFASANNTNMGSPYSWMRHSAGYASSITSAPNRLMVGGSMTEAESLESLSSTSSMAAQLRDVRSNSLTQGRIPTNQRETSPSRSPRLNRSNSIRSTKSEKLYPSMLQRSEDVNQYYSSQLASGIGNLPTSPMHGASNRLAGGGQGPYSSTPASNHSVRLSMSPYSGFLAKIATKEDEINGSSLSLVSTASSIYSSQEERQAHEIRKLKRELGEAQEKVQTLTNQLSTNAHVVAAFEQSLSNMTQRLQSLSASAEQKDSEVNELRKTIELLRKQSIEAGLTSANFAGGASRDGSPIGRQLSADSVSSINSISSACSGTSHSHASGPSGQVLMTPLGTPTHHGTPVAPDSPNSKKKHTKSKGWLRSSFTKAFSRSKSNKNQNNSPSEMGDDSMERPSHFNGNGTDSVHFNGHYQPHPNFRRHLDDSAPASPSLTSPHGLNTRSSCHSNGCSSSSGSHSPRSNGHVKGSGSSAGICEEFGDENSSVDDLKKQLREKEMVLTDIRLEALTSAHQLESFKETVNKMRSEMLSLKQDNERLQRMVSSKSLTSSQNSLHVQSVESLDRRLSASETPGTSSIDLLLADGNEKDGKRITLSVFLGCHGSYQRYLNSADEYPASECTIGSIMVSSKVKWEMLDTMVKRTFKDYVMRLDPSTSLGLSTDSIGCYSIGEVTRSKEGPLPDLLPCGYLVGDVSKIQLSLKGALTNGALDALAFETLIPKSILQRYISLLLDHGRMILCGPSGTGKSYLARKLGEFIVARSGKEPCPEAIATFSADHKNSKELRQYLSNFAEQCETSIADLPSVIILDNLHQITSFGEVFNGFLNSRQPTSPIIIGTMSQSNSNCANLPLHHNFRWVLFGNHMDPVKGFLNRYLQRRLVEVEMQNGLRSLELGRIIEWIPKVWHHVNKFLEIYNSADVTIGPRLFLSCPMDVANSQAWFTDLWHYSIVPYLMEAVKEGVQLYGKKAAWEDPVNFLLQTYPWTESLSFAAGKSALQSVRAEDVGFDKGSHGSGNKTNKPESNETDPLMNMLMRLQEAANYSGPQSNDSDSTSLDSHSLESKDYTAAA